MGEEEEEHDENDEDENDAEDESNNDDEQDGSSLFLFTNEGRIILIGQSCPNYSSSSAAAAVLVNSIRTSVGFILDCLR